MATQCFMLIFLYMIVLLVKTYKGTTGFVSVSYENKIMEVDGTGDPDRQPCPLQSMLILNVTIKTNKVNFDGANTCPNNRFKNLDYSTKMNKTEIELLTAVKRECNGKPKCELKDTWTLRPNISCNEMENPADKISMSYICLPAIVPGPTVTDLQTTQNIIIQNRHFVVLRDEKQYIKMHCQLSVNESKVEIKLLYIDLICKEEIKINETQSISFVITNTDGTKSEWNCSNSKSNQESVIKVYNATLAIQLKGFIWMEITGPAPATMTCAIWKNYTSVGLSKSNNADLVTIIAVPGASIIIVIMVVVVVCRYRNTNKDLSSSAEHSIDRQVRYTPSNDSNSNYTYLEKQYQDYNMTTELQGNELCSEQNSHENTTETKVISTMFYADNNSSPRLTPVQQEMRNCDEFINGDGYSHLYQYVDFRQKKLENIYNM